MARAGVPVGCAPHEQEDGDGPPVVLLHLVPEHGAGSLRGTARCGLAATSAAVRDVVHLGGDLEDGARVLGAAVVVVVDVEDVGGAVVDVAAVLGGQAQAAVARDVVGLVELRDVRDEDGGAEDGDVGVQVVVGQVEHCLALGHRQAVGPLDGAREGLVRRVERRLPHVAELVDPPGISRLVGHIVEEYDDARVVDDHLGQRRPGRHVHGLERRRVDVVQDARLVDVGGVQVRRRVIAVLEQDGHDVEAVRCHPVLYIYEPVRDTAGIEDVTGRVAEVRYGVVDRPVHLALEEAHAIVQLLCHGEGLVRRRVARPDERGVVAPDVGDVAVPAVAELDGWVLVTVGAVDVDEAVVEKFPVSVPVTVDVIVMEPERYVSVSLVRCAVSVSVALSVAESTPLPASAHEAITAD
ncbi:hypothetical protein VM1G_11956 [Cytospora mali]|uniref:Uncharacterized protein n=1 Tax=Cytospora mali TaxID=578113 RepID=A0A194WD48_CYTMA|nr:hypothetical protein VM1G_11956 [Valsa mali]